MSTLIAILQVMKIGAMVKSALEIDEDTMIQFHVHREDKHKGSGSQKIFIWTLFSSKPGFNFNEIHIMNSFIFLLSEVLQYSSEYPVIKQW